MTFHCFNCQEIRLAFRVEWLVEMWLKDLMIFREFRAERRLNGIDLLPHRLWSAGCEKWVL